MGIFKFMNQYSLRHIPGSLLLEKYHVEPFSVLYYNREVYS